MTVQPDTNLRQRRSREVRALRVSMIIDALCCVQIGTTEVVAKVAGLGPRQAEAALREARSLGPVCLDGALWSLRPVGGLRG